MRYLFVSLLLLTFLGGILNLTHGRDIEDSDNKKKVAARLIIPAFLARLPKNHIRNKNDFALRMNSHTMIMLEESEHLVTMFPEEYGQIRKPLLHKYIIRHDISKGYTSSEFQTKYNYQEIFKKYDPQGKLSKYIDSYPYDMPKLMFRLYGKNAKDVDGGIETIKIINAIDKTIADDFFKQLEPTLSPIELKKMRTTFEDIEKISDFVERGSSKYSPEEFNRKMKSGSKYLKDEAKKLEIKLANSTNLDQRLELQQKVTKNKSLARKAQELEKLYKENKYSKLQYEALKKDPQKACLVNVYFSILDLPIAAR